MLLLSFAPWGKGGGVSASQQSARQQPSEPLQRLPLTTPLPHPHRFSSLGGRDAVVFVAGQGVSVRAVTSAQMLDVYRGTITDWQALGGTPGPIRAIGRQPTATPRSALSRYLKGFGDMLYGANVKIVHLDPQTIALLDRYPTSLGFLNRSGLFAAKTKLVVLELDAVLPTSEAIQAGSYPVVLELGLAYKASALTEAGRAFLQFVTSPTAASVLRQYAVVPVAAQP